MINNPDNISINSGINGNPAIGKTKGKVQTQKQVFTESVWQKGYDTKGNKIGGQNYEVKDIFGNTLRTKERVETKKGYAYEYRDASGNKTAETVVAHNGNATTRADFVFGNGEIKKTKSVSLSTSFGPNGMSVYTSTQENGKTTYDFKHTDL